MVYLVVVLGFVLFLFVEYINLSSALKKVPLKILVNGTRGKSTSVKLIYDILRVNGFKVFAKTTGNYPQIYFPNNEIKTIKRYAPAGIIENIRYLHFMARKKPDAIVLECNALQAETQRILSNFIFKPDYIVLVNILPDHQEIMGGNLNKNVSVIAESLFKKSKLIVNQNTFDLLKKSDIKNSKILIAGNEKLPVNVQNIPENVLESQWQLISTFSNDLNLDDSKTKKVFQEFWNKISNEISVSLPDKNIELWDLFSVNDIISTEQFINFRLEKGAENSTITFLLNCREDRPLRTKDFSKLISGTFPESRVFLIGSGRQLAARLFKKQGFPAKSILMLSKQSLLQKFELGFTQKTLLFCVGNYKNMDWLLNRIHNLKQVS